MPKWSKILLSILAGLLLASLIMLLSLNTIVRNVLIDKVDKAIANADSIYVEYESLDLDVLSGEIRIKGVVFQTDKLQTDSFRAFSRMEIDDVWLEGVNYMSLFLFRELDFVGLIIDGVRYDGILDTKAIEANDAADAISEEQRAQFKALLREAQKYLNRVTLERLVIKNATADVRALETGLHMSVRNIATELYDLGYSLSDSMPFHYNDSLYGIQMSGFRMTMPDSMMNLKVASLYTIEKTRSLVVTGIRYGTDLRWHDDRNYHLAKIDTIRLDSIDIPNMRTQRSLSFRDLRIVNVSYYGCIDETVKAKKKVEPIDLSDLGLKTAEAQFLAKLQIRESEMMNDQQRRMLATVQLWLDKVKLGNVSLENANVRLVSHKSDLDVMVKDINLSFHDLGYSLIDSIPYHFDDQHYGISIGRTLVTLPDGLTKIECRGFSHADCGPVRIGRTHVWNTVDKWRLAHLRGDVSSTWVDITVDTFLTSAISPFSTVRQRRLALDNVSVKVSDMTIFADNRNLTIGDFKMPSKQSVMEVMRLFAIRNINLELQRLETEIAGHYSGSGRVGLENCALSVNSVAGVTRLEADHFFYTFPDSPMLIKAKGIHTNPKTHDLVINGFEFASDTYAKSDCQYHMVKVDSVVLEGLILPELGLDKEIEASCLRIVHPQYVAFVDEHPDSTRNFAERHSLSAESVMERKLRFYREVQQKRLLQFMQQWLDDASLSQIHLDHGAIDVRSFRTGFSFRIPDFSLHTSGVGFNLQNYMPISFSDSVVNFDPIKHNFKLIGSSAISYLALRNLHTTLPDSSMYLNVRRVDTDRNARSLIISGLEFSTDTIVPLNEMYHHATLDTIRLDGLILPDFKEKREASASSLRIINGNYRGILASNQRVEAKNDSASDDHQAEKVDHALDVLAEWFDGASLDLISVENINAEVTDLDSHLHLVENGLNLSFNDISYSLNRTNPLLFNDSIYSFGIDRVRCLVPDSSFFLDARDLRHANRGGLSLGRTHMQNTIDKWQIAHTNGDVPTTWFSLVLDTFHTSAIDPMRIVNSAFKLRLDTVAAVIDTMYIFRDMRYKPKKPYQMPQPPILALPQDVVSRFSVKVVDGAVNKMILEFPSTNESKPHLEIDSVHGVVSDLDLREGKDLRVSGEAIMGGGHAHLDAKITLKPECPWNISLRASDIQLNCMDSMLYPLTGMTLGGKVTDLRAIYGGDSVLAEGYVLMAYDTISAVFHKGSPTPYKFLRDNPKFLTWAARAFLPKNNPGKPGRKPRAYKAKWKNDVWQPSATFMMGPLIQGAIETILPGLYAHKRVPLDKFFLKPELK